MLSKNHLKIIKYLINKVFVYNSMIQWLYFPKSKEIPEHLFEIITIFKKYENEIESPEKTLESNDVLNILSQSLEEIGFKVEKGKKKEDKIVVPVLFGINGRIEKSFEADAYHSKHKTVIEIEAGRGVANNQFLKDLFQACMMYNVNYFVNAVRNIYETGREKKTKRKDFETVINFYNTLYASGRLNLPLDGVLIIGY